MKTNKELEEELRKMANQYWSLKQEVKVFLDAAEVIHDYDRVKQSESIYREEFTKAVEACAWMHEDKSLGITVGARITVDGVMALKKQRDDMRDALTLIANYVGPDFRAPAAIATDILSNASDDRQLPGHTAQPRNQTPTG